MDFLSSLLRLFSISLFSGETRPRLRAVSRRRQPEMRTFNKRTHREEKAERRQCRWTAAHQEKLHLFSSTKSTSVQRKVKRNIKTRKSLTLLLQNRLKRLQLNDCWLQRHSRLLRNKNLGCHFLVWLGAAALLGAAVEGQLSQQQTPWEQRNGEELRGRPHRFGQTA